MASACGHSVVLSTATNSPPTVSIPATIIADSDPPYEVLAKDGYVYPEIPRLTCDDLKQKIDKSSDFIIIDDRGDSLFKKAHIPGAINIPYAIGTQSAEEAMDKQLTTLPDDKLKIIYCD